MRQFFEVDGQRAVGPERSIELRERAQDFGLVREHFVEVGDTPQALRERVVDPAYLSLA